MEDRKELDKDIGNIQGGFNEVNRIIGQARQKMMETRIKVDNGKVEPEELSKALDEIVDILSLEAEKGIQDLIDKIRCLQGEMNRQ